MWEYNIKTDLRRKTSKDVDWIYMAKNGDQRLTVFKTTAKLMRRIVTN